MTHALRGGVGPFKIFGIDKGRYTVERDGEVLSTVDHISEAYEAAQSHNQTLRSQEERDEA